MKTLLTLLLAATVSCKSITHKPRGSAFDPAITTDPSEAVILVYRKNAFTEHGFHFPVEIDNGVAHADLCNSGYLLYRTKPGRHVVSLLLADHPIVIGSDTHISLECAPGSLSYLRVAASLGGRHSFKEVDAKVGREEIVDCRLNDAPWEQVEGAEAID